MSKYAFLHDARYSFPNFTPMYFCLGTSIFYLRNASLFVISFVSSFSGAPICFIPSYPLPMKIQPHPKFSVA
ncbi:hypothetical protein BC829DRAFT_395370 [Chytridium lagenaria]|nr:hypothetical protein BC829DRAFT_395370 [Chytridium lagenaria]